MPVGFDPNTLGKGIQSGERGKIAELYAQMLGFPSEAEHAGDAGFYGANPMDIMRALVQRRQAEQRPEELALKQYQIDQDLAARRYAADQALAGHRMTANALRDKSSNYLTATGMRTGAQEDIARQRAQSSERNAMLGYQGKMGAAGLKANAQMQGNMIKSLDPQTRMLAFQKLQEANPGANIQELMQQWGSLMQELGFHNEPPLSIMDMMGGGMQGQRR